MNKIKLINGNCLDTLKNIPNESIDLIVTDHHIQPLQEEMLAIVVVCFKKILIKKAKCLHITISIVKNTHQSFTDY